MVKLICLDMDGTLLNSRLEVSAQNRLAVQAARDKGIAVTLATGRMFGSALSYARELDLETPIIAMNGALTKHPVNGKKLRDIPIGREKLRLILDLLIQEGYRPNFYDEYNLFVGEGLKRYRQMRILSKQDPRYAIRLIEEGFTYKDLIEEAGDRIQKGIFFPGALLRLPLQEKLLEIGGLSVVSSSPDNLEITHKEADKGKAVLQLAADLGIDPQEVMAIGDSENDKSMLLASGYPVAMGDASDSVRSAARYVTDTNDLDGVALAIRRFALGESC